MSARAKSRPLVPFERFQLDCGATLLVAPSPGAPVTAIQAHLRGGHSLDPVGREGTAWMTGRLVDQGTEAKSESEIASALEPIGGSLNGGSSGLSGTVASAQWKQLFTLFTESLTRPTFPKARVDRQRERLLDRLAVERKDPRVQAEQSFRALVYGKHWLGRSEVGTIESTAVMKRADLARFHRQNWVASRAVIAVAGDVQPDEVARFLDRRLADWPAGKELGPPDRSFPKPGVRSKVFAAKRQQVHVYLGHLGIERSDPDYAKLVVMDHILGTGPGFTARITKRLRDELGLAYTVHAAIYSSAGVLPGMFTAYIGTSPEHFATALEGFLVEMRRIRETPVSPEELQLAKDYLTGSFALGFERASRRAGHLIALERHGFPENHVEQLLDAFRSATADEIQAAAARHLHPARTALSVGGPIAARDVAQLHASLS
ncbi:MAG: pitrilysin family protein [Planctomycetota bacterium]